MLSWIQGRVGRRYLAIIASLIIVIVLFERFGISHAPAPPVHKSPSKSPSTSTSSTASSSVKAADIKIIFKPSSYDWSKAKVFFPVKDMKSLPSGHPKSIPKVQAPSSKLKQDDVSKARADKIREKFIKSWEAYKAHAWTLDELMPLSGKGRESLSGWGVQIIDALDTLWIMDLKDEFWLGVKEVAEIDWADTTDTKINLFEVTIRYLGGLLAAYDLSKEQALLAKAKELGDALYATFDTPNRMPNHWLNYMSAKNGMQLADDNMSGAAGGTLCMEFTRLSILTGDSKYYDATERVKQFFLKEQEKTRIPGMWPKMFNYKDETVLEGTYSMGAGADSLYEYLPKMYALLGGLDTDYATMTIRALEAGRDSLFYKPMTLNDANILMVGNGHPENDKVELFPEMQHLTCFIGGTYGLTGKILGREDFLDLATRLTEGCVWSYSQFATGIMPEVADMYACKDKDAPCEYTKEPPTPDKQSQLPAGFDRIKDASYMLRPEAIESVFYMWRITGNQHWRDVAWTMWESIVKQCETERAFATISDVRVPNSVKKDRMETFWLGETVKYFYLIFAEDSNINLDEWVFNTEAHPVKRLV